MAVKVRRCYDRVLAVVTNPSRLTLLLLLLLLPHVHRQLRWMT